MPSRFPKRLRTFAAAVLAAIAASALPGVARADEAPPAPAGAAPPAPAPADPATPPAPADPAEGKPARPPPLPPTESPRLPWDRMLDVGGDLAFVARPATGDRFGNRSRVRYQPATGFALHIRWPLFEHLQIEGYFLDCHLPVLVPRGALGLDADVSAPPVETFVFGARLSPKITWGPVTASVTAGAGWGRFEFQRMSARTSTGATYTLRERGGSFVEIPLGLGVSWAVIPRWLSIDLQATAAFVLEQHGDAFDHAQAVDPAGRLLNVGPMPIMDASLVQTIGFSLLL